MATLNRISTEETESRVVLAPEQTVPGVSVHGIAEAFPMEGPRSLYGATKLCSELLIHEYAEMYGVRFIINRCGVIAGPWQMGKVDQGVFALWVAHHYFGRELSYIGWGGHGKQVRDLLHVADLAELIAAQLGRFDGLAGSTFNVGGGPSSSLSLLETTALCREITGHTVPIRRIAENRPADLKIYIADTRRVTAATGWQPRHTPRDTLTAIYEWIRAAEPEISHLWLS
jgi:CDP-paratose 2-epimerase